ncbi:NTP transferase domain-containing protein [Tenacibaculum sp. S7007]|uniref:NTP transferase domain-containing protein n=1 Tax=Tenacibaculum pelagium TaxID=2759527 RepID=A0A839APH8_9FLAO|nr:mannose-1-phosphate guanylyltransferase [Tenacibaculum pelagium]MBA6156280.1 NTP transferase domain-containing protein [Tenacibaculum pelagium]
MTQKVVNVILSGGSGTRLWPLSRESKPKQFLPMFDKLSLFQHTIMRNKKIASDFLLVTNSSQINYAEEQIQKMNIKFINRIIEPVGRNTAPAIALAALSLNDDDIMIITPSDHMIGDLDLYKESIERAIELANKDFLVTFGIKPRTPNTGFGYIAHDKEKVLSFREKPDINTAISFLKKGNFSWNSGMFCFKASTFLEELYKYNKNMYLACKNAYNSINNEEEIDRDLMLKIPSDSIDYTILEKSDKIKIISSNFYWTDLGTFDAIVDYFEEGNAVDDLKKINVNSFGFVSRKEVYTNVEGIIVIDTEDGLVVLERNKTNDIKKIYNIAISSNALLK